MPEGSGTKLAANARSWPLVDSIHVSVDGSDRNANAPRGVGLEVGAAQHESVVERFLKDLQLPRRAFTLCARAKQPRLSVISFRAAELRREKIC